MGIDCEVGKMRVKKEDARPVFPVLQECGANWAGVFTSRPAGFRCQLASERGLEVAGGSASGDRWPFCGLLLSLITNREGDCKRVDENS